MARMSTVAASRVNRRFLFLALILGVLSAVLVYAAVSDSGNDATSVAGVTVVVAKQAIPGGTLLTEGMLEVREVPSTAVGDRAFQSIESVVGETARFPIAANEQLLRSKIVGASLGIDDDELAPRIPLGMLGMAISTSQVVGAGGLVLPGDHVNVYWLPDEVEAEILVGAVLIAENIEVLSVQQTVLDIAPTATGSEGEADAGLAATGDDRIPASRAEPDPEALTVTLLLTPAQVSQVFCADGGSGVIRLAVRAIGDNSVIGAVDGFCVILPEDA